MNQGLKILLYPLSVLYRIATSTRNRLYDWRIFKESRFDLHTIGIGNLAVGGAGKTPMVEYLIRLLLDNGFRVGTLSRGYKRKTSGFVLASEKSTVNDIGDEPMIFKQKYGVHVAVDGNRVRGIMKLQDMDEQTPSVVLLDDVFQHRSLKCGLSIVLTDYNNLYFKDELLPAGTLRESKSGINRADIIVISKTPERTSAVELRAILKDIRPRAHQKIFFSYLKYGEMYSISDTNKTIDTLNDLYRYRIVSFAGIVNALPMTNYLKEYCAELRHLPFPDHYQYGEKDLRDIDKYFRSLEGTNKILVTTEKDYMRLQNFSVWDIARKMDIYILPVEVTFGDKQTEFDEIILKYVNVGSPGTELEFAL